MSARAKLVHERLRKQREEEEHFQALQDAERKRIEDIEAAEADVERVKEEERQRKKQKEKEKVERQKREGTYMTKAQKVKARLTEQRIEAMRAAGMMPVVPTETKKVEYGSRKRGGKGKGKGNQQEQEEEGSDEEEEKQAEDEKKADSVKAGGDDEEEDWEKEQKENDDESGDDWDDASADGFDDLAERLEKVAIENDDTDLIEIEKKKEQERLKKLGLERVERDRIEAEKRALHQAVEEEENRQASMAAQKRAEGKLKRLEVEKTNLAARSPDDLRCPVVVIMGHVDTGKRCSLRWRN
jgi:translation initiation factor 5B